MTKYWAYRCQGRNCRLTNEGTCLVSIDEMPTPSEFEGACWITGNLVTWILEEVQD